MKLSLSVFATTFLIVTMRHFGMDHYRSPREGVLLTLIPKGNVNLTDLRNGALYLYSTSTIQS